MVQPKDSSLSIGLHRYYCAALVVFHSIFVVKKKKKKRLACPSVTRSLARRLKLQNGLSRMRPHRSWLGYRAAYSRADAAPMLLPHRRYRLAIPALGREIAANRGGGGGTAVPGKRQG